LYGGFMGGLLFNSFTKPTSANTADPNNN